MTHPYYVFYNYKCLLQTNDKHLPPHSRHLLAEYKVVGPGIVIDVLRNRRHTVNIKQPVVTHNKIYINLNNR
jgi:hypothetical protein